jgi:hypothetical protein
VCVVSSHQCDDKGWKQDYSLLCQCAQRPGLGRRLGGNGMDHRICDLAKDFETIWVGRLAAERVS